MLLRVIFSYLEQLLPLLLFLYGVGMILYACIGTAVGFIRSIPIISLVVFVICLFLLLTS